jgi:hypothetical protein
MPTPNRSRLLATAIAGLIAATVATARAEFDIAQAFKDAHQKKSVDAVFALVWMEGVDQDSKEILGVAFEDDFEHQITKVGLEDGAPSPADDFFRENVRYRLNLPVVKRLRIEFAPPTEAGAAPIPPSVYRLGRKNDRYYIAAPAPVSSPTPATAPAP